MQIISVLLLLIACSLSDVIAASFKDAVGAEQEWIQGVRRHLHQYPELLYEEEKTSEIIRTYLDEIGVSYKCEQLHTWCPHLHRYMLEDGPSATIAFASPVSTYWDRILHNAHSIACAIALRTWSTLGWCRTAAYHGTLEDSRCNCVQAPRCQDRSRGHNWERLSSRSSSSGHRRLASSGT